MKYRVTDPASTSYPEVEAANPLGAFLECCESGPLGQYLVEWLEDGKHRSATFQKLDSEAVVIRDRRGYPLALVGRRRFDVV